MLERMIVFVEEESAEAALLTILPRLLPESEFQIIRFQGKQDMLRNLPVRLRGYSSWLPESWSILVLVDRDNDDCKELKGSHGSRCSSFNEKFRSGRDQIPGGHPNCY